MLVKRDFSPWKQPRRVALRSLRGLTGFAQEYLGQLFGAESSYFCSAPAYYLIHICGWQRVQQESASRRADAAIKGDRHLEARGATPLDGLLVVPSAGALLLKMLFGNSS